MSKDLKHLVGYLTDLGIEKVPHSQKNYLAHLIAVYRFLEAHGFTPDICRAGLFHSIYGTQGFQGFKVPLESRPEIRELIGPRAEQLAYLNCVMDRETLDFALERGTAPFRIQERIAAVDVELSTEDFDDLIRVHLFDWLEQARSIKFGWNYRRAAYRRMTERLGPSR